MSDTVVLSRVDYEALLARIEDAEDAAALAEHRAYEKAVGKDAARADCIPAAIVDRLIAGENPIRVWRDHRNMTAIALAEKAEITPAYLSQLEHGRRHASQQVLRRLATALKVDLDDLVPKP